MVGMPWSMPPSRSRTTVIPCSSTYRQSSILGERYRQPASSRQMMFISEAPPFELLLLGIPEDVERVALVVVQVEPHPLAAPRRVLASSPRGSTAILASAEQRASSPPPF